MCPQTKMETENCVGMYSMLDGEYSLCRIFNQKLNKTGGANDEEKTKWKTMKL